MRTYKGNIDLSEKKITELLAIAVEHFSEDMVSLESLRSRKVKYLNRTLKLRRNSKFLNSDDRYFEFANKLMRNLDTYGKFSPRNKEVLRAEILDKFHHMILSTSLKNQIYLKV